MRRNSIPYLTALQTRQEFTDRLSRTCDGAGELLELGLIAVVPCGCGERGCPGWMVQAMEPRRAGVAGVAGEAADYLNAARVR